MSYLGSYSTPEARAEEARREFLMAVGRLAPQVVDDLRALLPEHGERANEARRWSQLETACAEFRPYLVPLREALRAWAEPYHLVAPWVFDHALGTLQLWEDQPALTRYGWFPTAGKYSPITQDAARIVFVHEGADLTDEKRGGARERILRDFAAWLDGYLEEQSKGLNEFLHCSDHPRHRLTKDGLCPATIPPHKPAETLSTRPFDQTPRAPRRRDHVEWFVRYQVLGWSPARIARGNVDAPQSVTDAVTRFADLVGLKKRPPARSV